MLPSINPFKAQQKRLKWRFPIAVAFVKEEPLRLSAVVPTGILAFRCRIQMKRPPIAGGGTLGRGHGEYEAGVLSLPS
jgi:hypothetical protein